MKYLLLILSFILEMSIVHAQNENIIHLQNKTIEVTGLEHWTVKMIQDSLDKYSPGDSLQSHACAAILRYKLHFADASVITFFPDRTDFKKQYVLVSVVEPEDSSRVHYKRTSLKFDTLSIKREWKSGINMILKHPMAFQAEIALYLMSDSAKKNFSHNLYDTTGISSLGAFLKKHNSNSDAEEARFILKSDSNFFNRMAAAAMLIQFSKNDTTWWSLMDDLLESDGPAKTTSQEVLAEMTANKAHLINWMPEAKTIHAILDGTSLFSMTTVCNLLVKTGAKPEWAKAFLKGGGRALIEYAGAHQEFARKPALSLLCALRGKDLGNDAEVWRKWIESL